MVSSHLLCKSSVFKFIVIYIFLCKSTSTTKSLKTSDIGDFSITCPSDDTSLSGTSDTEIKQSAGRSKANQTCQQDAFD